MRWPDTPRCARKRGSSPSWSRGGWCEGGTTEVLSLVYAQLTAHRVALEGTLLKPNMVVSGKLCPVQAGVPQVAEATGRTLRRGGPPAVPGPGVLSRGARPR